MDDYLQHRSLHYDVLLMDYSLMDHLIAASHAGRRESNYAAQRTTDDTLSRELPLPPRVKCEELNFVSELAEALEILA